MKKLILPLIILATIIIGCATQNPNAGKPNVDPQTGITNGVQPAYIPNTTGTKIIGYANEAAPLVPPPYGTILGGAASLAAIILGAIAKKKNDQANTATLAAQTLAEGVVKAGPTVVQTVQEVAANTSSAALAAVATHINNATD